MHARSTKKRIQTAPWSMHKSLYSLASSLFLLASIPLLAEFNVLSPIAAVTKSALETSCPLIDLKQTLTTQTIVNGNKSYIQSGEVVTFTTTVTNLDDVARNVLFATELQLGLTYVPHSLLVDGVEEQAVITEDASQAFKTLSIANLSLPAYRESNQPVVISFQAQVESFSSNDPVNFWLFSQVKLQENLELGSSSKSVLLVSEGNPIKPSSQSFALSEEVSQFDTAYRSKRVDARPGEVVTITMLIENQSELPGEAIIAAYIPQGLHYVPNSLLVDGKVKEEAIFSNDVLASGDLSVPAFGTGEGPVKLVFQVKLDAALSVGTCFQHSSHVYAKDSRFSSSVGDTVMIVVREE